MKADFEVTNESAPAVAEICARLDGLPLAIELAAARARILPPQKMLGRLSERLRLLKGGPRDLPTRQQTLRGTIDWSYELLEEEEKALFKRLAVFSGGRTLEAIEVICDPEGDLDALEGVESLVEKSLLRQEEGPTGEPRFVMLETVHEYAREKLQESGEADEIKRTHAEYFLALAEEAEPKLRGPEQLEWLEKLEAEHDNMRAALGWASERANSALAVRLAASLWWFWDMRGHYSEGRRWLGEALTKDGSGSVAARAKALAGAAMLAFRQGDADTAEEACEEGFKLTEQAGAEGGEARIHLCFASGLTALLIRNDLERARELFEEGLASSQKQGHEWGVAGSLINLATIFLFRGDQQRARELLEESLALFRKQGDKYSMSLCLANLADGALAEGELERAAALSRESVAISRELGTKGILVLSLLNLGCALLGENLEEAEACLGEALILSQEMGAQEDIAACLEGLACVAGRRGEASRAARLFGAAEAWREASGIPRQPSEKAYVELQLAAVRASSGEAAWEEALAEGRPMTLEEAVSYALKEEGAGG